MANTNETLLTVAKKIRAELRSRFGWTNKQVSVRTHRYSMGESVYVTIKDPTVPLPLVETIAEEHKDRSASRFVTASYETGVLDALAAGFEGLIVPGFRFGSLEVIDKASGGWMSVVNTVTGTRYQDAYPDASAPAVFARAVASCGEWSGWGEKVAALAA